MLPEIQLITAAPPPARSAQDLLSDAVARHHAGSYAEAEQLYRLILATEPRNPDALHGLGLLATQAGRFQDAIHLFDTAIQADSHQSTYYLNLGNALHLNGQVESATIAYRQCLHLSPNSGTGHSNLGMALLTLGRLDEAVQHLQNASALLPTSSQIHDNLGNALQSVGRLEEAVTHHRRALQLTPAAASQVPEILGNLGLAFAALGKWEEATESFDRALHRNPQNARIQLARAQLQLLLGEFESGLRNYEWRKQLQTPRKVPGKPWHGERLAPGETLLLLAEQGLGDSIQMLRYLHWVQLRLPKGALLAAEIQKPLLRLAQALPGSARWLPQGEPLPPANWHCSWMTLPLVFMEASSQGDRQNPPTSVAFTSPYLSPLNWASSMSGQPIRTRSIPSPSPGRAWNVDRVWNVGLAWSGSAAHVRNPFRSISPGLLKPLLQIPNCRFHSLQIERLPSELAGHVLDHSQEQADFADTADLIQQLDLVISVDTSIAHLAGALAASTWVLLSFWPDWRWGLDRQDSPWYPTMRLFRQQQPGNWPALIESVRAELALLSQTTAPPQGELQAPNPPAPLLLQNGPTSEDGRPDA
jgi:tetratricopeptide (TPR) repeat protein